jgi:hypothetical protein
MASHLRSTQPVIDKESERTVTRWLRLGDRLTGRKQIDGRCDRCGRTGYVSAGEDLRLCAKCYLEGAAAAS